MLPSVGTFNHSFNIYRLPRACKIRQDSSLSLVPIAFITRINVRSTLLPMLFEAIMKFLFCTVVMFSFCLTILKNTVFMKRLLCKNLRLETGFE